MTNSRERARAAEPTAFEAEKRRSGELYIVLRLFQKLDFLLV
jgi:hypothetical protein